MISKIYKIRLILLLIVIYSIIKSLLFHFGIAANNIIFWLLDSIGFLILPLIIYLFGRKNLLFNNFTLGLSKPKNSFKFISDIIIVSLGFLFIYFISQIIAIKIVENDYLKINFSYYSKIPSEGLLRYIIIIYFSITAGFVEEFYYRGILKLSFNNIHINKINFYIFSGFLFSIIHWNSGIIALSSSFIIGIYAAAIYLSIENLWPLIIGHTFTDLVYFNVFTELSFF